MPSGVCVTIRNVFPGDRDQVRFETVRAALELLKKHLEMLDGILPTTQP